MSGTASDLVADPRALALPAIAPGGLVLDGETEVLLCASVFSFRIPRALWRSRLTAVRDAGYRLIDLYIPWNHHETRPGVWDFSGERDVAAFLDLAHELGLMVIARPGPYICSEWDGGALPAWLTLDEGLLVRQAEPRFLARVAEWFDRVLPLIAARQRGAGDGDGAGGAVVAVQLENELDFFDTADRAGYIGALRDLALERGIRVPLVACAGQGDLSGASGAVDGVIPAANFYPDDDSPFIEAETRHYTELLADRGLPLLVTETNRVHRTLRRLVVSGARVVAPYLQASGYNHGYTPSVGNWGDPGGFMTHDYDFGGFLSPTGEERPEVGEARRLAGVVGTLGSALAGARIEEASGEYSLDAATSSSPSRALLVGGGRLVGVVNLDADSATATLSAAERLPEIAVPVPGKSCVFVIRELPLDRYGVAATLALATGDLVGADARGIELVSATSSVIVVRRADAITASTDGPTEVAVERHGDALLARVPAPGPGSPIVLAVDDWTATVRHPVDLAPRPVSVPPAERILDARRVRLVIEGDESRHEVAPSSEAVGVYRGRTRYETATPGIRELLIVGAADIVDLDLDGSALPSIARFGATERIVLNGATRVRATVETWGHANFDDARLPALRLGSTRGLGSVWSIDRVDDVGALWSVEGNWAGEPAPLRELGGWSSTRLGAEVRYRRRLPVDGVHWHALRFELASGSVLVELDGLDRTVSAEDPWLLLEPGRGREVAVRTPHWPGRLGADLRGAELFALDPVTGWSVTAQPDTALVAGALHGDPGAETRLPLNPQPGEEALLDVTVPPGGLSLRFEGAQVRLSVFAADRLLGRVWLGDPAAPVFTGGDPGRVWLPAAWNEGRIRILVRGTAGSGAPELTAIEATASPE